MPARQIGRPSDAPRQQRRETIGRKIEDLRSPSRDRRAQQAHDARQQDAEGRRNHEQVHAQRDRRKQIEKVGGQRRRADPGRDRHESETRRGQPGFARPSAPGPFFVRQLPLVAAEQAHGSGVEQRLDRQQAGHGREGEQETQIPQLRGCARQNADRRCRQTRNRVRPPFQDRPRQHHRSHRARADGAGGRSRGDRIGHQHRRQKEKPARHRNPQRAQKLDGQEGRHAHVRPGNREDVHGAGRGEILPQRLRQILAIPQQQRLQNAPFLGKIRQPPPQDFAAGSSALHAPGHDRISATGIQEKRPVGIHDRLILRQREQSRSARHAGAHDAPQAPSFPIPRQAPSRQFADQHHADSIARPSPDAIPVHALDLR